MNNILKKATKGTVWSALQQWGTQLLNILLFAVLARLVSPVAFGQIALINVFIGLIGIFVDQGMGIALVQKDNLEIEHRNAAFIVNIGLGLLMLCVGVVFSAQIAALLGDSNIGPMVAWSSLSFLFIGLSSTPQALLQRNMEFKALAIRSTTAKLGGGLLGVLMALNGAGAWSLVGQKLGATFIGVLILWGVSDWRPKPNFSKRHFRELMVFGGAMLGRRTLAYLESRFENVIIAHFLDTVSLGYYSIAYKMQESIMALITSVINSITLPLFSRFQKQIERLRWLFSQATHLTALISFPIFVGLYIGAPELIPLAFGEEWLESISVMRILAVSGVIQSTYYLKGNLIIALGKPGWSLLLRVINTVFKMLMLYLVVTFSEQVTGVALAALLSAIFAATIYSAALKILLGFDFRLQFRGYLIPILGTSVFAVLITFGIDPLLDGFTLIARILVKTMVGVISYFAVVFHLDYQVLRKIYHMLTEDNTERLLPEGA